MAEHSEFLPEDAPIKLGRSENCKVKLADSSLSRFHCKVDYIGDRWMIRDGDGDKESMNGTWLFCDEEARIDHQSIFKAGLSIFQVKVVD